jgi:hypothetical protein
MAWGTWDASCWRLVPTEASRDVVELRLDGDDSLVEDFKHRREVVAADFEAGDALLEFYALFKMMGTVAGGLVSDVPGVSDRAPATGSQRTRDRS